MFQFQMLNRIDQALRMRVERIVDVAAQHNDNGIVAWAERAAHDALALGRLRDRDVATLERLEDTYNHDFYRSNSGSRLDDDIDCCPSVWECDPIYA